MISFIKGATKLDEYPNSNKEVVFVGRSNVGKSSLINALFGKIAYVGKTPGKTRILNFFNVDDKYTICDVPGYGFANRSQKEIVQFGDMMETYFSNRKCLQLCVVIIDIRHKPTTDDIDMIEYLKEKKIKYRIVANKADKLSNNEKFNSMKIICETLKVDRQDILEVSCLKKNNIEILKDEISH